MKKFITIIILIAFQSVSFIYAHDSRTRIELEKRIKKMEQELYPLVERYKLEEKAKKEKNRAYHRIIADNDIYSREELRIIESLYHQASQEWASDKTKELVKSLEIQFPRANRTGCAVLRHTLTLSGDEKTDQLIMVNNRYKSCYFPDGVNIGAFSQLVLIMEYMKYKKVQSAQKEIEKLKKDHPHAIDHQGILLLDRLEELKEILPGS